METFSALLALCAGNSPVPGEFPAHRSVTWSFDVFFDLRLNKRLRKQSWGWWFETLSRPLWRDCNDKSTPLSYNYMRVPNIGTGRKMTWSERAALRVYIIELFYPCCVSMTHADWYFQICVIVKKKTSVIFFLGPLFLPSVTDARANGSAILP